MVSRFECTRVHFVQVSVSIGLDFRDLKAQVSVLVSTPDGQGLGLDLET